MSVIIHLSTHLSIIEGQTHLEAGFKKQKA